MAFRTGNRRDYIGHSYHCQWRLHWTNRGWRCYPLHVYSSRLEEFIVMHLYRPWSQHLNRKGFFHENPLLDWASRLHVWCTLAHTCRTFCLGTFALCGDLRRFSHGTPLRHDSGHPLFIIRFRSATSEASHSTVRPSVITFFHHTAMQDEGSKQ